MVDGRFLPATRTSALSSLPPQKSAALLPHPRGPPLPPQTLLDTLLRTRIDEGQKFKRGMAHSPLETPLRKRSDDDQEMKISAIRSFCVAGGGRPSKHTADMKKKISDTIVVDSMVLLLYGTD